MIWLCKYWIKTL